MVLENLVKANNGYLFTAEAIKSGFSKQQVNNYVKKNRLEKVVNGVYVNQNTWIDELYVSFQKNKGIVFSYETALLLHGLTDKEPISYEITVKYGYNATHLKKRGFIIHTVNESLYNIGITSIKTQFGNVVNVYDMERTICDIIRNRKKIDIQVFSMALKEYLRRKEKRIPVLLEYAKKLHIYDKVKEYLDILL